MHAGHAYTGKGSAACVKNDMQKCSCHCACIGHSTSEQSGRPFLMLLQVELNKKLTRYPGPHFGFSELGSLAEEPRNVYF